MNSQLIVIHIIPNLSLYGGTARKYLAWLRYTDSIRHVYLLHESQIQLPEFQDIFIKERAEVIRIEDRRLWAQIKEIAKVSKRYGATCIFGHHFRGAVLASSVSLITKIPAVIPLHGPAHLFPFTKRVIYKLILRVVAKVIYNSEYTAQTFGHIGNLKIIYNGIDYQNIPVKKEFNTHGKINLMAVGALVDWKNYALLVKMMKFLDDRFNLTIIGDGPKRDSLILLANELNLDSRISIPGRMQNAFQQLEKADMFLHPSIKESFGIAVLEAVFARVPVVISDCCATTEIIWNGKYGWIASSYDPRAWAETIEQIVNNPVEAWNKAYLGRQWALTHFSSASFSSQMEQVLNEVKLERHN